MATEYERKITRNFQAKLYQFLLLGVVAFCYLDSCVCWNISMATSTDYNLLAEAFSDFAIKLYKTVSEQRDNVLISPFSISTALSMVLAGARGNTAEQMKKVLNIDNVENMFTGFSDLLSHLNSANASNIVNIANRLFLDEGMPIADDFTLLMKKIFQADCGTVSFSKQPLAAKEVINSWVSITTNEKIKELLTDDIDPMTRLILVSAIYFKGFWEEKFSKDSTEIAPFHLNSHESVEIEMMHQKKKYGYMYDSELKANILSLSYEQNAISLIIILPDEMEGLGAVEHQLDSNRLNKLMYGVRENQRKLHLYLPKFKLEESLSLKAILSTMGMVDMFSAHKADLSGIVESNDLYVEAVVHKTYIDVNEEGTEAAAATGVRIMKRSLEIIPEFRADHPFLFLIVDNSQNFILFIGALKTPRAVERRNREEL